MSQLIFDNGTHQIHIADGATIVSGPEPIRVITTQAFYRRMTQGERSSLRAATPDVVDLREDLARSDTVDLDGIIEQQLQSIGFTQARIDELLVDGTV